MRSSYPAASESDIRDVEQQLGITLPDDYRGFLMTHNGGLPEDYLFVKNAEEIAVRFFGVNLDAAFDYDDAVETATRYNNRIPSATLPIGADPGGNLLLLGIAPHNAGQIYYWDHSAEHIAPNNVRLISNSFTDFVVHLQRDPGEP